MHLLIIKTSALGDILQCFPVIGYFKRYFPEAVVDWVVEAEYKEVLAAHPHIGTVVGVATRAWRRSLLTHQTRARVREVRRQLKARTYDVAFDLQGNIKSAVVMSCVRSRAKAGFSFRSAAEWPASFSVAHRYHMPKEGLRAAQYLSVIERHMERKAGDSTAFLAKVNLQITAKERQWINKIATFSAHPVRWMVCMGSRWENKRLALATWKAFLTQMSALDPLFFLPWASAAEKKEVEELGRALGDRAVILPKLSIPLWQQLMANMDGVIAVDSGALHLAATTSVPSFAIFGPSSGQCYQLPEEERSYFQGGCPYGEQFVQRCRALRRCPTGACLKEVAASDLARLCFAWWDRIASKAPEVH